MAKMMVDAMVDKTVEKTEHWTVELMGKKKAPEMDEKMVDSLD